MKTIFVSDDGVKDKTFIKIAGKYAEGVYATGPKDTTKNKMAVAAIEEHRKAYGSDPGAFFLNAYAAATALMESIQKAGSLDYNAFKNTSIYRGPILLDYDVLLLIYLKDITKTAVQ